MEPGAECPDCGRKLEGEACKCGWHVQRTTAASARCVRCGTASALSLDDDGALRCAGCHVRYLQERAALDPISGEELAACRAQILASLAAIGGRR